MNCPKCGKEAPLLGECPNCGSSFSNRIVDSAHNLSGIVLIISLLVLLGACIFILIASSQSPQSLHPLPDDAPRLLADLLLRFVA
jgi:hypothetical protein